MKSPNYKVKIGIVGCGAIGSRMAKAILKEFKNDCRLTGLYDVDIQKAHTLSKELKVKNVAKRTVDTLINSSDCVVEATNAKNIHELIRKSLTAKKTILVMSVGKILDSKQLFNLARKNKRYILLPSGAIAGIDAIKAASLVKIDRITLTTRKPPKGLRNNEYLEKKGIDLNKIKKETVLYYGGVENAVKNFPQNINVAATIALACQVKSKLKIKIITSPKFKKNVHEIEMKGDFGHMITRTENLACPENPKSSYLAVLSGLQTLKQYCTGILVGT